MIINLLTVVVKKHFGESFSPASHSRRIFKNSDSRPHKGLLMRAARISSAAPHAPNAATVGIVAAVAAAAKFAAAAAPLSGGGFRRREDDSPAAP